MLAMAPPKKKAGSTSRRKHDPWDKKFGERLKVSREGASLSQQAMADALKIPVDTYQKYEHGRRSFPKHRLAEIVRITRHGPWFLLTGEPEAECPANQPRLPDGGPSGPPTQAKDRRPTPFSKPSLT